MRKSTQGSELFTPDKNRKDLQYRDQNQGICLPEQLTTAVPPCAINCLQTFVQSNYFNLSCSSTADLSFLCSQQTVSGLTIGEAAFQCQISKCLSTTSSAQDGYNICNNIPNAVPRTATTITATIIPISSEIVSGEASKTSSTALGSSGTLLPSGTDTREATAITTDPTPSPTISNTQPSIVSFTGVLTASINSSSPTSDAGVRGNQMASGQPGKTGLSTVAIAGIAAGGFLIFIVALCYFSYWFRTRKRYQDHGTKRPFSVIPPTRDEHLVQPTTASTRMISQTHYFNNTAFEQDNRDVSQSGNIGLAVTSIDYPNIRARSISPQDRHMPAYWPAVLSLVSPDLGSDSDQHPRSRSVSPFYEDLEAQDQELPALRGSQTRRSSSRSASSGGVERPAPLRLSKSIKNDTSSTRMQLTPTYDNGTYSPEALMTTEPLEFQRPPRTSSLPYAQQRRQDEQTMIANLPQFPKPVAQNPSHTLPGARLLPNSRQNERPLMTNRKQSNTTDKSLSVCTVIEEDETPDEQDKQLGIKAVQSPDEPPTPVRDLRWPAIPRSASTAKQAIIAPRPRQWPVRPVGPLSPPKTQRDQLIAEGRSFIRTNTSSSDNTSEIASAFPLPPTALSPKNEAQIARQISNAMKTATSDTYALSLNRRGQSDDLGQQVKSHVSPSKRHQTRGFRPLPSIKQSPKSPSTAHFAPKTSPTGEMYFTVHL